MALGNFWKTPHQKERAKLSMLGKCLYSFFKIARTEESDIRVSLHNNSHRDENAVSILLEIPSPKKDLADNKQSMPFNISSHVVVTILLDGRISFSAYQQARQIADKKTILDLKGDDLETLYDAVIRKVVNDSTGMFDIDTLDIIHAVEGKRRVLSDAAGLFARFDI